MSQDSFAQFRIALERHTVELSPLEELLGEACDKKLVNDRLLTFFIEEVKNLEKECKEVLDKGKHPESEMRELLRTFVVRAIIRLDALGAHSKLDSETKALALGIKRRSTVPLLESLLEKTVLPPESLERYQHRYLSECVVNLHSRLIPVLPGALLAKYESVVVGFDFDRWSTEDMKRVQETLLRIRAQLRAQERLKPQVRLEYQDLIDRLGEVSVVFRMFAGIIVRDTKDSFW